MSQQDEKISRNFACTGNSGASTAANDETRNALDLKPLFKSKFKECKLLSLSIRIKKDLSTSDVVSGFLHLPRNYDSSNPDKPSTAAILLSGAGGGVVGPSSIYLSMSNKLASLNRGIPVLRLNYRHPANVRLCCQDVQSAMRYLTSGYGLVKFVLVGWSFGSAPVFTVASNEHSVIACATIAGQTAHTDGIRLLHPRPVLLLHGTGDKTLSPRCSQKLYEKHGSKGDRKIHLFEGDNHALTKKSREAEEMLCKFIVKCAGLTVDEEQALSIIRQQLIQHSSKIELMKKGGDLRGGENVV